MSFLTNISIGIGVVIILVVLQAIFHFFGIKFFNNTITVFCLVWIVALILFNLLLPKDYLYFKSGDIPTIPIP